MKKHFVTFLSPGTMVSETTTKAISAWDTNKAIGMAKDIKERHAATPYGFYFFTKERKEEDFDSKETKRSNTYYLGGEIFTLEDIKNRNDPKDKILISNMECNGYDRIIENKNSWKSTHPLKESDIVLYFTP